MPCLEASEFGELVAELLHEYCVTIFYKKNQGSQFSQLKQVSRWVILN